MHCALALADVAGKPPDQQDAHPELEHVDPPADDALRKAERRRAVVIIAFLVGTLLIALVAAFVYSIDNTGL